jgi:predicted dienelactone hydrolase
MTGMVLPAAAQTIGVASVDVPKDGDHPAFNGRAWYPATGGSLQTFGASRIRSGYEASPDATPALGDDAPLVILIHGSGGSAQSTAWLALGLAERLGALVVAADHPGSSGGNPERASILEVWQQPADVTRLIDFVLTGEWATYVDASRVYVAGFSLGGAAAMSLAGTRLEFERFPLFCENHDDGACRAFRPHFAGLDSAFFERSNADLSDPRVRRAAAIAPGFTESVTGPSLARLSTPLLMIAGSDDQQLPPDTHLAPIRASVPAHSRVVEIEDAQHFSFLPLCREGAIEILAEDNEEFVCQEFGARSREAIHEETLGLIVEFFSRERSQ